MDEAKARIIEVLREADWLDAKRARGYCLILAILSLVVAIAYLGLSRGGIDPMGKPVGTDFASFWTASKLALEGRPADVWSMAQHRAVQAETFGADAGYAAYFYPPPYLLVCLPLAVLPYTLSLIAWLLATFYAWLRMVRAWLASAGGSEIGLLPLIAFPAVLLNAGHGQNGFLIAALMGGGALLHERTPWLAGVLFGALVVKPQFGVLLPFYLASARDWRCFVATGGTAVVLCALSLLAFGLPAWEAFIANSENAGAVLAQNSVGYHKMQSVFAAARLLGLDSGLAWVLQGLVIALALGALLTVRRRGNGPANGAALCCASLLATPFVLDYDLTLLAVPLAWTYGQAQRTGFMPWEKLGLLAGFILPLVSRPLAETLHLPLAPVVIMGVLLLVVRRVQVSSPLVQS